MPHAPLIIHPFNYGYFFENLLTEHHLVGGVDLDSLTKGVAQPLAEIVDMQSKLIFDKAQLLKYSTNAEEQGNALLAESLLAVALEKESLRGSKTLGYGEYTVRANAMIEPRRLVGGIVIEKV